MLPRVNRLDESAATLGELELFIKKDLGEVDGKTSFGPPAI